MSFLKQSLDNIKVWINEIIENSRLFHGYSCCRGCKGLFLFQSGCQKELPHFRISSVPYRSGYWLRSGAVLLIHQ